MIWENFMLALRRTFDFTGRSRREEFWSYALIVTLFGIGASFWDNILPVRDFFAEMVETAFFITSLAVSTRRLHDTGRSGWWQLLWLTGIGGIVLLIWYAEDSDFNANEYGESPKYGLADDETPQKEEEELIV